MRLNFCMKLVILLFVLWTAAQTGSAALPGPRGGEEEKKIPVIFPTAIFPFQERGAVVAGYGEKVSDLLFAHLAADPHLLLVDRAEMKKQLEELELSLSGMMHPAQALKVGCLTGAKILITGSVLEEDKTLHLIAKIIGTETSRVLGASVAGEISTELNLLVKKLAKEIGTKIEEGGHALVAREEKREDRITVLKRMLPDAPRPKLFIQIKERHVGQATVDPAAETELVFFSREAGFEVIDPKQGSVKDADVILTGEGFSEFALRRGNLIAVKARVEVKALDRKTNAVLAVDRQTTVVVDLTEQIAGKTALQKAAASLAMRLLLELMIQEKAKKGL